MIADFLSLSKSHKHVNESSTQSKVYIVSVPEFLQGGLSDSEVGIFQKYQRSNESVTLAMHARYQ